MNITAAIVDETDGPFVLDAVDLADPGFGEVRVKIAAVGMCHTDLSVRSGATPFPLPAILGHEGAGVVDAVGPGVTDLEEDDHVLLSFTSCGNCTSCRANRPVYCRHWLGLNLLGGHRLDGTSAYKRSSGEVHGHFFGQSSFATHTVVAAHAAVRVDPAASLARLAPLGCSVQTGAGAVLNVARPEPGANIVVFGAGGVGLAAIMAAQLTPAAAVIAVDVNPDRLELATALGATHVVDARHGDVESQVTRIAGGARYAIETSGRLDVLAQAVKSLGPAGTCVVIGAPPLGSRIDVDVPDLLGRGIRIVGTNQGDSVPRQMLPALVDLVNAGRLPLDRVTEEFAFEDINRAADAARSGEVIKPVLVMS